MTHILLVIYSILELSGIGGWSTNNTALTPAAEPTLQVAERGSYAYGVHLGYALQFHRNVGIGIGVDLSRYGSSTLIEGDKLWMNVTDTEGETYHHRLHIYSLSDKMEQLYVNIPIALRLIAPVGQSALEAQLGVKVGLPLSSSATYSGDVEHYGMYPQWGDIEMSQVPNHGFYRTQDIAGHYDMPSGLQAFAFAKIGVVIPLTYHLQLSAHVGVDYGILGSTPASDNQEVGANTGDKAHYFMPAYRGIYATTLANGSTHPLSLTGEIGLRFVLPHQKKYPCMCYYW